LIQKPSKTAVLGIPVSSENLRIPEQLDSASQCEHATIVTFVNPHACSIAESNQEYLGHLQEFDWVLCDGIGMVIAARRISGLDIDRTAFDLTSVAGPVCEWLAKGNVPLVLVGGKPGVSDRAAELLNELFPALNIVETFSGYDSDPGDALNYMAEHQKAALVCGMGAPRQEKFLIDMAKSGWKGIGFTCGGFFDQLGEKVDYYPKWIDRMNLRFLYRLGVEPRRLWRRYLIDYQVFLKRYLTADRVR